MPTGATTSPAGRAPEFGLLGVEQAPAASTDPAAAQPEAGSATAVSWEPSRVPVAIAAAALLLAATFAAFLRACFSRRPRRPERH